VRIGNAIYTLHKQRVYYTFSHFLNTRISVFAFFHHSCVYAYSYIHAIISYISSQIQLGQLLFKQFKFLFCNALIGPYNTFGSIWSMFSYNIDMWR